MISWWIFLWYLPYTCRSFLYGEETFFYWLFFNITSTLVLRYFGKDFFRYEAGLHWFAKIMKKLLILLVKIMLCFNLIFFNYWRNWRFMIHELVIDFNSLFLIFHFPKLWGSSGIYTRSNFIFYVNFWIFTISKIFF